MKTIWKFETPFEEIFKIEMPKSAEILGLLKCKKILKLKLVNL